MLSQKTVISTELITTQTIIISLTVSAGVQDKQVSVVAGTAADANRVAYVKTVRPSSVEVDEAAISGTQSPHRYTNEVPSFKRQLKTFLFTKSFPSV